jgi:DNA gyrase subunit A
MGVKFVTPKGGDAVAVVARSVEAPETDEAADETGDEDGEPTTTDDSVLDAEGTGGSDAESPDAASSATIDETADGHPADSPPESEA